MPDAIEIVIEGDEDAVKVDPVTGVVETKQPDGGVVINLDGMRRGVQDGDGDDAFYGNLVEDVDLTRLGVIANDLADAIDADDRSRQEYLQIRAKGLDLLGIKLQPPTAGDSTAAVDGLATVTNPLLLDAILKGWANAQAELLPANGPVKIRDDGDETAPMDELAEALERDANHYLTKTATEYYPDTSHMLLWGVYFGGSGFKKVYRCPMRRRPVSDTVDAKDLIVSDTTKDLRSCGRITHQISMRPSILKRMILLGAYRDAAGVAASQPNPTPNAVDSKIAGIQGTSPMPQRPEDQPYTIWETQCELDLDEFAPPKFKGKGVPLPYLVTMDKDSRQILAIRRDWFPDDDECERRRMYVKFPYVPGPGFYGTGMLNILGNASAAMTAAWRESLDLGMFAAFPGGLMAKQAGRQNTSDFRLSAGTFQPIETGGLPIGQVIMGMPYRVEAMAPLMSLIEQITNQAKGVAGAADVPTAEGIQNVPVGTMLAQIEQATKVIAAAHKGMHQAQSEEFELLFELFRETPEDFWRHNKVCPKDFWSVERFISALDQCGSKLTPVSDPNVPSHIHRVAKALALVQLIMLPAFAPYMEVPETLRRVLSAIKEDPKGLLKQPEAQQAPPDLQGVGKIMDAKAKMEGNQVKAADIQSRGQQKAAELVQKKDIETIKLASTIAIHQDDAAKLRLAEQREQNQAVHDKQIEQAGLVLDRDKHALATHKAMHDARMDVANLLKPEPAASTPKPKGKGKA